MRQRKSWSSSSAEGCLNETTCTPCGLTPDITCLITESLPAASSACRTMSSAYRSVAQSSSCASESSAMPRAIASFARSWSSSWARSANSGPPVEAGIPLGDPGRLTGRDEELGEQPLLGAHRTPACPGATARWTSRSSASAAPRRRSHLRPSMTSGSSAARPRQANHWRPVSGFGVQPLLEAGQLGGEQRSAAPARARSRAL